MDAEAAFAQVAAVIDKVLENDAAVQADISTAGCSAFWHSLLGVDEEARPTTPVLGWADNRSRDFVEVLRKAFNESDVHNRTGARIHSSYWPAKLLWLQKYHPEAVRRTKKWLSFSDFVSHRLFGVYSTSVSMASATGLFDIRQCTWDDELPQYLKVKPDSLPEIVSSDDGTFRLLPSWQERWPKLGKARWAPAIGDGAANNIGAGCIGKTKAALMVGTSGALRSAYKGDSPPVIPQGLWCYRIDRQRVVIGGALSNGGGLYQWLRETLRLKENAEAEIAKRPPAGHGLTFLPFLAGERGTGYNENASGAIIGIKTATDAIDILQAAMESVAYRFAEILEQLNSVCNVREISASGGALRNSPIWTQIIADVLGRELTLSAEPEASLRGAALFALNLMEGGASAREAAAVKETGVRYHPEKHRVYQNARLKQNKLIELLPGCLDDEIA